MTPLRTSRLRKTVVVFGLLFHFVSVRCELVYHGQGRPPFAHSSVALTPDKGTTAHGVEQKYTEVFVSAVVDKLLGIDDESYQFEVAFFLRLSWHDPRAAGEISRRTNETFAIDNDGGCLRPCGPGEDFCCDSVWLPGLTFMNALSTGGGFDWESIELMRGNNTNVMWFRRVVASFHTTMSFHRFPFDSQRLVIDMWKQSCCIFYTASSVGLASTGDYYKEGEADDISSWRIGNLKLLANPVLEDHFFRWSTASHAREVYHIGVSLGQKAAADHGQINKTTPERWHGKTEETVSVGEEIMQALQQLTSEISGSGSGSDTRTKAASPLDSPEDLPEAEPQQEEKLHNTRVALVIQVHRIWEYYIFIFILPLWLTVALSWSAFCVSPEQLELRIGTSVTLFLALTGQQYTISEHLPASSYVTCMGWMVIWSYVLLGASVVQSLFVSYISEIVKSDKMMKGVLSSWQGKVAEDGKKGKADDTAREAAKNVLRRMTSKINFQPLEKITLEEMLAENNKKKEEKPKVENVDPLPPLVEEVGVAELAAILGCSDALLPEGAKRADPSAKTGKGFLSLHRFGSFQAKLREHGIGGVAEQIRKKIVANPNITYLLINKLDEKCMVVFPLVYTLGLVYICWPTQ